MYVYKLIPKSTTLVTVQVTLISLNDRFHDTMALPSAGCRPIKEIPPEHFTYGRSDSDDPSLMEPKTGHVRSQVSARVLKSKPKKSSSSSLPATNAKSSSDTSAWRNFPIVASKRGRSNTTSTEAEAEAATTDAAGEGSRPRRKRRATVKGELNNTEVEAKKKRLTEKQNKKDEKAHHVRERAEKAIAIVAAQKPPESSPKPPQVLPLPMSNVRAGIQPSNLKTVRSASVKLGLGHGSSSEAESGESSGSEGESDGRVQQEERVSASSETESEASIATLAAEDAARAFKKSASRRSQMTRDLRAVFSEVHMARHPKSKLRAKCRTCCICE
jgi:hypothetical protein